jgi:RNA polymerase sigma factor (sigma-70 family)
MQEDVSDMIVSSNVSELVEAARQGDQRAWDQLVERYMPLVRSVIRRYRLTGEDAADVSQTLWLRLVEHLDQIRESQKLPGWIVTTTRNECLRVLTGRKRTVPVDPLAGTTLERGDEGGSEIDDELLRAERHRALREGLQQLRPFHRELLMLLIADPALSYDAVSQRLGIPRGSIGPTRARALDELRRTDSVKAFLTASDVGLGR